MNTPISQYRKTMSRIIDSLVGASEKLRNRLVPRIRPAVHLELREARYAEDRGEPVVAFRHLERAHVLSQSATTEHVRVHWRMLRWGLRARRWREVAGQVTRIVGAATKTAL